MSTPDSRKFIPCRWFATGFCKLGKECPYMHDEIPPGFKSHTDQKSNKHLVSPCKYFLDGFCKNGTQCNFLHFYDAPATRRASSTLNNRDKKRGLSKGRAPSRSPAPAPKRFVEKITFRGTGQGSRRESRSLERNTVRRLERSPRRKHVALSKYSSKIKTRSTYQAPSRVSETNSKPKVNTQTRESDVSNDSLQIPVHLLPFKYNCEICQALPKFYGLLLRCNHSFCLDCLRKRRTSLQIKNGAFVSQNGIHCPSCNAYSASIIPSHFPFPNGGFDKLQVIENKLLTLSKIVCKHFLFSLPRASRYCPYKDECLRAHPIDGKNSSQMHLFEPRKTSFLTSQNNLDPYEALVRKIEAQSNSWEDFIEKTGDTDSEGEDSLIFVDKDEPFYGYDSDEVMNNPSKEIFIGNSLLGIHRIALPFKTYSKK